MIARMAAGAALGAAVLIAAALEWREPREGDAWALVDALGSSKYLPGLAGNAVLLAPHLWDGANVPSGDGYLSDYLSNLAGHTVRVTRSSDGLFDLLAQGVPVYWCERVWLPGHTAAALLIGRVHKADSDAAPLQSDKVTVVTTNRLMHMALEYRGPEGVARSPVIDWRREQDAYLTDVPAPGWTPASSRLVDEESGGAVEAAVALDFVRGFALVNERSGGHYFRWNDGTDGEAQFNLVNSLDRPLTVRFRAMLRFNPAYPTGGFVITTREGRDAFRIPNQGVVERVWTLEPGANPVVVKCLEPYRPTPGDTRKIVFGLWDWTVTPVAPGDASR